MKRIHPILRILFFLMALWIICISSQAAMPDRDQIWCRDVYADRQETGEIIISTEDVIPHSFYGIKIGDKKNTILPTLRPAFSFMYELKEIGHAYLLSDKVYPDYYLTVLFDNQDQVWMIRYQKKQKYELT